jgi:hypothetical protein
MSGVRDPLSTVVGTRKHRALTEKGLRTFKLAELGHVVSRRFGKGARLRLEESWNETALRAFHVKRLTLKAMANGKRGVAAVGWLGAFLLI